MSEILSAAAVIWRQQTVPEVFLARRVPRMRFFGSVYAFCGGRVDPADTRLGLEARPDDPRLGSLQATLVREVVEELGIDLREGGRPVEPSLRSEILQNPDSWARRCAPASLGGVGEPCIRLVTPEFYPRRFDASFFVVEVETDCAPDLLKSELDAGGWDSAAGWLGRWTTGEFRLAPPAVLMLRILAAHEPDQWESALRRAQDRIEDPDRVQEIRVDPAVRLMALRTPTLPPATHTNGYLIGNDPAWLVDPASPYPDERARLVRTLDEDVGQALAGVLLTHDHPDHTGAAEFVASRYGVPVLAHEVTAQRLAGRVPVDREIADGELLEFGHADGEPGQLLPVFTPGHARGHLCFHEPRYGGLIAGDMVSTLSSILIDPADGDMRDYLRSLERLAGLQVATVYPAHGPPDCRGADLIRDQIAHRREREAAVLKVARSGPVELEELTARVWKDVPRPMLGYARKSAVSILRKLVEDGAVVFDGEIVRPS